MAVKIRLKRMGKIRAPFYRVVVADGRMPRDGRYIELVGGGELRLAAPDSASVSYWVFPTFRGQGYARRALTLLCQAAARLDGVCWAEAHIDADNLASRRVAERAGFVETGVVKDQAPSGELVPRVLYTLALTPAAGRYSGQRPTPPS